MVEILRSGVVRVVGIARLLLIIASVGTPELRGGRLRALKPGYKRSQKRLGSATIPGTPYEVFLGAAHRRLESTGKSFRQISEARLRCRIGSDRPALCMGIMQPRHEMVVGRAQWRKQGKYGECKSTARVDFRQKCIRRTKKKKKKKRKRGAEKHHHYRRRKSRPAKGWSDWVHLIYLFPTRTHRPAMLY